MVPITKFEIEQAASRVWQDAYKTVLTQAATSCTDADRLTALAKSAAEGAERDYRERAARLRGPEPAWDAREFALGFLQKDVAPGITESVTTRPQVVFYGERLVIPEETTGVFFSVIDFKVGNRSQLVEATEMPALAFSENAHGIRLVLDPALPGQDVTLVVKNKSDEARLFRAVLFGTGIDNHDLFDRLGLPWRRPVPEKDAA